MIEQSSNGFSKILGEFIKNGYSGLDKISVYTGNFLELLSKFLKDKAYYGKVVIFAFENAFLKLGTDIKKSLLTNKISTIDVIFKGNEEVSVNTVSKTFILPDDIRAIIVLDSKLSKVADYVAFVKKIPIYDISVGLNIGEFIEDDFSIKNGDEFDLLKLSVNKTIIADFDLRDKLSIGESSTYDYIMSNLLSLIDVKINAYFNDEKLDAYLYNLKNKKVVETFSIMKEKNADRVIKLSENSFFIGLINKCAGKSYCLTSSIECVKKYYYKHGFFDEETMLYFAVKILNLTAVALQKTESFPIFNDYNTLSENTSLYLGIKEKICLNNLLCQLETFKKKGYTLEKLKNNFANEIISLSNSFNLSLKTHIALGGKDIARKIEKELFNNSLKCASLLTDKINCLSILLKEGISDLI